MAHKSQKIYCYETKQEFQSRSACAKFFNKQVNSISNVLDKPHKSIDNQWHLCTDLSIFDGVELTHFTTCSKKIYCYETGQEYSSVNEAIKQTGVSRSLFEAIDKPDVTCGGYHWCTDLEKFKKLDIQDNRNNKIVYCYELRKKFDTIIKAKEFIKSKGDWISDCLDKPHLTAGGYHWCTSLDVFDGVELSSGNKIVYCYETKEKFDKIVDADEWLISNTNIEKPSIYNVLNNPKRTMGGYHWCTSLDVFDGVEITRYNQKILYCYETKEKFESIKSAANYLNHYSEGHLIDCINDRFKTAGGYHFCTSLDIFDGVELIYTKTGSSSSEKEVVDYIKLIYNKEIIENSRNIISPYELDIYIPDLNLAFEFNGDYWHSEQQGKDRNYHITKTNLCKEKGIQLIHIYEYQWRNNKEVWLSFIANKLKVNPNKVYARKCEVRLVESNITKEFCDKNHLQGSAASNINLGLYYNDELISVMTFIKSRFNENIEWELARFCNKRFTNVIGGASKLLKYFEVNFKPKSLLSYTEIDYSYGNLYSNLGFELSIINKPSYIHIKRDNVYPRYQTMKKNLHKIISNYNIELTEFENLDRNGFYRIWKCGTYTFIKNYV